MERLPIEDGRPIDYCGRKPLTRGKPTSMSTVEFVVQRVANECRKTEPVAVTYFDVSRSLSTFGRPCRKAKLRTESSMADFHISYCCELLFCQTGAADGVRTPSRNFDLSSVPRGFRHCPSSGLHAFLVFDWIELIARSFSGSPCLLTTLRSIDVVEKPINHYSGHRNVQPDRQRPPCDATVFV